MIDLVIQFKLIIFSFIFGFLFSALLEYFNKFINRFSSLIKFLSSVILVAFMTYVYFIGIQKIGNAIFHIYSIMSIVLGFITYDLIIKLIANNNKKWYTYYGDNMAKRRVSKATKRRLTVLGPIFVVIIVYFIFSLLYNVYTIYKLSVEKKELEASYLSLQEEAEQLKIDIEKLNDPSYLADYAREKYLYSKEGEYILKLDEMDETSTTIDSISTTINKNYIILGLSFLMFLVFIYILRKGKTKKKSKKK